MSIQEINEEEVNSSVGVGSETVNPVDGIPGYIQQLRTSGRRGDIAELRRMRVDSAWPEVFWRIIQRYKVPTNMELFWASLMPVLADAEVDYGRQPGTAMAEAGISKTRFERWCRYDQQTALVELRRILAQVEGGFNWQALLIILSNWGPKSKRQLAREYFKTYNQLHSQEK